MLLLLYYYVRKCIIYTYIYSLAVYDYIEVQRSTTYSDVGTPRDESHDNKFTTIWLLVVHILYGVEDQFFF